jgi:hypothetical protein
MSRHIQPARARASIASHAGCYAPALASARCPAHAHRTLSSPCAPRAHSPAVDSALAPGAGPRVRCWRKVVTPPGRTGTVAPLGSHTRRSAWSAPRVRRPPRAQFTHPPVLPCPSRHRPVGWSRRPCAARRGPRPARMSPCLVCRSPPRAHAWLRPCGPLHADGPPARAGAVRADRVPFARAAGVRPRPSPARARPALAHATCRLASASR